MREGEVILCVWEDPGVTYSVKTRGGWKAKEKICLRKVCDHAIELVL